MKHDHPVRLLCLYLKASCSGFYQWEQRQRQPCARVLENDALAQEIGRIHARSRQTYGAPRIQQDAAQERTLPWTQPGRPDHAAKGTAWPAEGPLPRPDDGQQP
jgi:hypothetical protein